MNSSCTYFAAFASVLAAVIVVMSCFATSSAWLGPERTTTAFLFSAGISSNKMSEILLCVPCSNPLLAWMITGFVFNLGTSSFATERIAFVGMTNSTASASFTASSILVNAWMESGR